MIRHRRTPRRYLALVHLDDSKTNPDGSPDQDWVRRYTWPLLPRHPDWGDEEYTTRVQEYELMQIRWLKQRTREDLEELTPDAQGEALPSEGDDL